MKGIPTISVLTAWMVCWPLGLAAQSDVVIQWVTEAGEPACNLKDAGHTLHVSAWVDGVTQTAIQGEDLVVDSTGHCTWPSVEAGVYTLEALPWAWALVVEPWRATGVDTVTLVWPSRRFSRLRQNPAPVRYAEGHPGAQVDTLQQWLTQQLDSLDLDQLMAAGAVGAGQARSAAARESCGRPCWTPIRWWLNFCRWPLTRCGEI